MYIGELNTKLKNASVSAYRKDTGEELSSKTGPNPINGEGLLIAWNRFYEGSIEVCVDLGEKYLVHEIEMALGNECWPDFIKVWNEDKTVLYSSHIAETGKKIRESSVTLAIEAEVKTFIIEFELEFHNIYIKELRIFGAEQGEMPIFPEAAEFKLLNGEVKASGISTLSAEGDAALCAIPVLTEMWQENFGASLSEKEQADIALITDSAIPENGYRLTVSEKKIQISASDLRGMVYGAQTLLKLEKDGKLQCCEINDQPRMSFRGAHIALPAADRFDFAKRLVKYLLSPMGYNYIILEVAGGMRFESHPEINEAVEHAVAMSDSGKWPKFPHDFVACGRTAEKEQVRDFVKFCRSYGIDVIPEIQSLGHVQFMTIAHPDIAELPEVKKEQEKLDARVADELTPDFYPHSYCPSNPKSYEILFDLMDEIIEVFEPRKYVHMGHDEVYQIGICPRCKDKDPADLYAEDVNRIYEYLSKKGLTMMIWSDMLQPLTDYKTPPAIHKIPKDIVCLDFIWYFHLDKDIEDNLLKEGFPLIYGNMYSSHFPRYEARIEKQNVMGGEVSTWVATDEEELGREGKLYDFLFSAQMMWSKNYTRHARYSYDAKLSKMLPKIREKLSGNKYPSLMKEAEETVFVNNGEYLHGESLCGGGFEINAKADSLVFEHTASERITRLPWIPADEIGHYEVTYADGSKAEIPVKYAHNISHWNRRHNAPFTHPYYRHNGYTATYFTDGIETRLSDGRWRTVYRYEWLNPAPERAIKSVSYVADKSFPTNVFVSRIIGVKAK